MNTPVRFYEILEKAARENPDKVTFRKRIGNTIKGRTYSELLSITDQLIAGLSKTSLKPGDRVLLLCDASVFWLPVDAAITGAGFVCVPRGTDVTDDDISYIVNHSSAKAAIVQFKENKTRLEAMKSSLSTLDSIYYIEDESGFAKGPDTVYELMKTGSEILKEKPDYSKDLVRSIDPDAMATLIYTSGTTGAPKGVMLSQSGWCYAVRTTVKRAKFDNRDTAVSLLPPWHAFERAVEYAIAYNGMDFVVSDISILKEDLKEVRPTIFPSVPRIWESVYNGIIQKLQKESKAKQKIFHFFLSVGALWFRHKSVLFGFELLIEKPNPVLRLLRRFISLLVLIFISPLKLLAMRVFSPIKKALGGKLRVSISGGSALPAVVDRFLSAIGITVLEGYGMTETSAVISTRLESMPVPGTVGRVLEGYSIRLKDDNGNDVKDIPGARGTLWVKSKQILMGYYKRPELNEEVFDEDGYFNTGDLMKMTYRGELMFAGRAKDTIALAGGENIEPVPIEDRLLTSAYIDQVMVVGDDRKTLGALIVPAFEVVQSTIEDIPENKDLWNSSAPVRELFRKEIGQLVSNKTGFKSFEMIPGNCFYISPRIFDPDTEMTRTLKMKRAVIKENFQTEINDMYSRNR